MERAVNTHVLTAADLSSLVDSLGLNLSLDEIVATFQRDELRLIRNSYTTGINVHM